MANHEVYVVQGKTLDNIAGTMRAVLGVDKDAPIRFDEVASSDKTEQINADIETQTDLIAQIKTALNGKAGSSAAEIGALIDQSGVLESTDGTATDKVEQLIDKAEDARLWGLVVFKNFVFQNQNSPFMNWAEKTIPKINFGEITTLIYSFSNSNVEYIDYYINSKKATNFSSCFSNCKNLVWLVGVDTSSATTCVEMFFNSINLESITEPFNTSKVTNFNKMFNGCEKLKEIRFVPETIKVSIAFSSAVLSAESIQSIIDGLATVETAQTLTLHKDAKILQSQVGSANAKGWTVAGGTVVSEEEYYG